MSTRYLFGLFYVLLASCPSCKGSIHKEETEAWIAGHMLKLTQQIVHVERHLNHMHGSLNRSWTSWCETGNYTALPSKRPTTVVTFHVTFKHKYLTPPCVSLTLHTLEVNAQGHAVDTRASKVDSRGFEAVVTLGFHARVFTVTVVYIACVVES